MNRIAPTLLLLLASPLFSFCQNKLYEGRFFLWKKDWSPTTKTDSAAYFSRIHRVDDTCWQFDTYNYSGPMVSAEKFKDEKGEVQHGKQFYYKPSGYIDSTGDFANGLPHGEWNFCDDTGRVIWQKQYAMGQLVSTRDLRNKEPAKKDSIQRDEKESYFPGGIKGWQKYLYKKLEYPERAQKMGIMGEVSVQFVVNTAGVVENVALFKSVEYSLDELTLSIIRNSPKWVPAVQDGRNVKSYKRQPLNYRF